MPQGSLLFRVFINEIFFNLKNINLGNKNLEENILGFFWRMLYDWFFVIFWHKCQKKVLNEKKLKS